MKRLFKFKYPKLALLAAMIAAAYFIFSNEEIASGISALGGAGYAFVFMAGFFFSFGFTTPFAIGYFVTAEPSSALLAAAIGGAGALIGDMIIFRIIRASFMDEFEKLERTGTFRFMAKEFRHVLGRKMQNYALYAIAGLVIASPLPDELGVTMLAGLSSIKPLKLSIVSFLMNTAGILVMLLI